jgi:hypothetical protein
LAASAPAAPEGAGAGCWLGGVCPDWVCGASGNGLAGFCSEAPDWLDWEGTAKSGISLEMSIALTNNAMEHHSEHLWPVRFIYALHPV